MNYYKHHIGDYDSHTAHLSWDEDMAYSRLLRVYYRTEQPIPADVAQACRLVRASRPAQRAAVEAVLREFFVLGPDGWHQTRCDREIQKASERAEINREVGSLGGRPKKPKRFPDETQTVSGNNPRETLATTPLANSHSGATAPAGHPAPSATLLDLKTEIWRRAVAFLESRDIKPGQTRPLVGRWIKALGGGSEGQTAMLTILASAEANCQGNVIEYVEAAIERHHHERVDNGEDRSGFGAVVAAARAVAAGH